MSLSDKDRKSERCSRWSLFLWHWFFPTWVLRQPDSDSSWKFAQGKMTQELSCMTLCAALLMGMTYAGATTPVDFFSRLIYQCEHHQPECNHNDTKTIERLREHADDLAHDIMQESCTGFVFGMIALVLSIAMMIAAGKVSTLETMRIFKSATYKCVMIPLLCDYVGFGRLVTAVAYSFWTLYPQTPCVNICLFGMIVLGGLGYFWITLGITDIEIHHRSQLGEHRKQNIRAAGGAAMTIVEVADAFQDYLVSVNHDVRCIDAEEFTEWISTEVLRRQPREKHANTYTKEFARKLSGDYLAKVMEDDVAKCLEVIESPQHRLSKGSKSESRVSLIKPANDGAEETNPITVDIEECATMTEV